jgi:exodeoxyribonuclease-3
MWPAGGDIPDRTQNPKFGQKLDFIERMTRWSEGLAEPTIIVGDFNVAPLKCDVWSHKALLTVVSHTPVEVGMLTRLQQAHDWIDIGRRFVPSPGTLLHLVELSVARLDPERPRPEARPYVGLARARRHLAAHEVLEPCRNWERPSDHVPLICEIEFERPARSAGDRSASRRAAGADRGPSRPRSLPSKPRRRSCSSCSIPERTAC